MNTPQGHPADQHVERPVTRAESEDLEESVRYAMWTVLRVREPLGEPDDGGDRQAEARELEKLADEMSGAVTVRGFYDVSGLRADADLMVWTHAESSDDLQQYYHRFRRTRFGRRLDPVWSQMGLHRPAEFSRGHLPAFLAGERERAYLCVYPFVRSYEWYLLPDEERRALLVEHGEMGREYPDVRANTVHSFALGDYEWLLAFEADDLTRIVQLMRHLRASGARRHVREEIPFYTGKRRPVADLLADLP